MKEPEQVCSYICKDTAEFERLRRLFDSPRCNIFNDAEVKNKKLGRTFREYRAVDHNEWFIIEDKGYNAIRIWNDK